MGRQVWGGDRAWEMVVEQIETWEVEEALGRQVGKWEARRSGIGRPEAALSPQQEVLVGGAGAGAGRGDHHLSKAM